MVTIDLRKDVADAHEMLADAVRRYIAKHKAPATAKKHPAVSRIDLTFSLGDSESTPWVYLQFDTKPGSAPDGDPTHRDFAKMPRKAWLPAVQAVCEEENVSVVKPDGKSRKCDGGHRPATSRLRRDAARSARQGCLRRLAEGGAL